MDVYVSDNSLTSRYRMLSERLQAAGKKSLVTPPHPPILIGASKHQPATLLEQAIASGLNDFGENKVQEAAEKWPALKAAHPGVRLHLIGPLQSNKAADAVALFDVIQTIDREKIVDALAKEIAKHMDGGSAPTPHALRGGSPSATHTKFVPPQLLIQVNIGEEPQKSGVMPADAARLLHYSKEQGLRIDGLMCVPPEGHNPAPYFALLHKMAGELGLTERSMGMSSDFETAARLGATMVRIGTALFGERS